MSTIIIVLLLALGVFSAVVAYDELNKQHKLTHPINRRALIALTAGIITGAIAVGWGLSKLPTTDYCPKGYVHMTAENYHVCVHPDEVQLHGEMEP